MTIKKESFEATLSKLLLEGKSIRRAIQLAVEANPKGYQQYIKELFNLASHDQEEATSESK